MPALIEMISPSSTKVLGPYFFGIAPHDPRTFSPTEARARFGFLAPSEEYARFRAEAKRREAAGEAVAVGPEIPESL